MGEKAAAVGVGDQDDGPAEAGAGLLPLDGIQYCSEHPYRPGVAAAAAAGGGICAFCLQEKLGMLVSSSKSSPFFPLSGHPPLSASPSSPPSFRRAAAEPPLPLPSSARSRKFTPFHRKKNSSSSSSSSSASATLSASISGGGLKRSKSVAPRPEEQQHFPSFASSVTAESPRKKSFWSFLYNSSSSSYPHQTDSTTPFANGGAAARRKSVSVASAAWASRGGAAQDQQLRSGASAASGRRGLEAIGEPDSPTQSQASSSSSFGRKVARSRSVGCGSRSFSGDFLERISFGDCTLRRVESQREPKANKMRAQGHLGGADEDDEDEDGDAYEHQHRIKCAGFFGGMGPASSSYWLSAAEGAADAGAGGGCTRKPGSRSHWSWAWALASPMRALRPTSSASTKIITAEPSTHSNGSTPAAALSISSPMPSSLDAAAAAAAAATN